MFMRVNAKCAHQQRPPPSWTVRRSADSSDFKRPNLGFAGDSSRLWLDICLLRCESKAAIHSYLIMAKHSNDRLQGTLDLLILKILNRGGPMHGYAIAQRIHLVTDDSLRIEEGSLYPALQRMMSGKWLRAQWGTTDTGRKARFYTITAAGRRQLEEEERRWTLLTKAVEKALRFA
jgi:PadR family transcriptional regulator, regulatory protein PadR